TGSSGNFEIIVFGAAIIALLQAAPGGLTSLVRPARPVARRAAAGSRPLRSRPPASPRQPRLDVRAGSKRFGGPVPVNNISFAVSAGEIVGLIGPNGAGKTTLFNLISGALRMSGGEIEFRNTRIDKIAEFKIVHLGMARTFQHVQVCAGMTVLDNVAIGA